MRPLLAGLRLGPDWVPIWTQRVLTSIWNVMSDRVSIKIPRPLYVRLQQVIGGESGFSSPTDFIVFVLRDLVGTLEPERTGELSDDELVAVRKKLENLGYL